MRWSTCSGQQWRACTKRLKNGAEDDNAVVTAGSSGFSVPSHFWQHEMFLASEARAFLLGSGLPRSPSLSSQLLVCPSSCQQLSDCPFSLPLRSPSVHGGVMTGCGESGETFSEAEEDLRELRTRTLTPPPRGTMTTNTNNKEAGGSQEAGGGGPVLTQLTV